MSQCQDQNRGRRQLRFMSPIFEHDNAGILNHSQISAHLDLGMLQLCFLCQQSLNVELSILACTGHTDIGAQLCFQGIHVPCLKACVCKLPFR